MKTLRNPNNRTELLRRLESITSATSRRWGRMSAQQMICHLCDAYRIYLGEIAVPPVKVPVPRVLLRWLALWVPIPWPRGFKTAPEIDQLIGGTPPTEFDLDKRTLRILIERCALVPSDFAWPCHPHFGEMAEASWMRLGYLHCDHHLRQFGA